MAYCSSSGSEDLDKGSGFDESDGDKAEWKRPARPPVIRSPHQRLPIGLRPLRHEEMEHLGALVEESEAIVARIDQCGGANTTLWSDLYKALQEAVPLLSRHVRSMSEGGRSSTAAWRRAQEEAQLGPLARADEALYALREVWARLGDTWARLYHISVRLRTVYPRDAPHFQVFTTGFSEEDLHSSFARILANSALPVLQPPPVILNGRDNDFNRKTEVGFGVAVLGVTPRLREVAGLRMRLKLSLRTEQGDKERDGGKLKLGSWRNKEGRRDPVADLTEEAAFPATASPGELASFQALLPDVLVTFNNRRAHTLEIPYWFKADCVFEHPNLPIKTPTVCLKSLPVFGATNRNQFQKLYGLALWRVKAGPGAEFVSWGALREGLDQIFQLLTRYTEEKDVQSCCRLSESQLTHLGTRLRDLLDGDFNLNTRIPYDIVFKEDLCCPGVKTPLDFTFWEWFYKCTDMVVDLDHKIAADNVKVQTGKKRNGTASSRRCMQRLWNDGVLHGFMSREEANEALGSLAPGKDALLLRFSDNHPEHITFTRRLGGKIQVVEPLDRAFLVRTSLPDVICQVRELSEVEYIYTGRGEEGLENKNWMTQLVPKPKINERYNDALPVLMQVSKAKDWTEKLSSATKGLLMEALGLEDPALDGFLHAQLSLFLQKHQRSAGLPVTAAASIAEVPNPFQRQVEEQPPQPLPVRKPVSPPAQLAAQPQPYRHAPPPYPHQPPMAGAPLTQHQPQAPPVPVAQLPEEQIQATFQPQQAFGEWQAGPGHIQHSASLQSFNPATQPLQRQMPRQASFDAPVRSVHSAQYPSPTAHYPPTSPHFPPGTVPSPGSWHNGLVSSPGSWHSGGSQALWSVPQAQGSPASLTTLSAPASHEAQGRKDSAEDSDGFPLEVLSMDELQEHIPQLYQPPSSDSSPIRLLPPPYPQAAAPQGPPSAGLPAPQAPPTSAPGGLSAASSAASPPHAPQAPTFPPQEPEDRVPQRPMNVQPDFYTPNGAQRM